MSTAIYICSNEKLAPLGHIFLDSFRQRNTDEVDVFWFVDSETLAEDIRAVETEATVLVTSVTSLPNTSIYDDDFFYGMTMKIFALEHFIGQYDRVVYFDVDTIINASPTQLINCDLEGKTVGAVKDVAFDRWPQEKPLPLWFVSEFERRAELCSDARDYVNSGVMVFDMSKIAELPSLDILAQAQGFKLLDQDYINHVFDGEIKLLPESFNYMADHVYSNWMSISQRMKVSRNMSTAIVQHFHAAAKPWREGINVLSNVATQLYTSRFYTHCDAVQARLGSNWVSDAANINRSAFELNDKRSDAIKIK